MQNKSLSRLAAATAALALFLVTAAAVLAQGESPAPSASPTAAPAPAVEHKTLLERIKEGGWVMFPIGLCSVLTVYLIGDGYTRTNPKKVAPPEQINAVKELFRHGDYVGAYNYCKANPSAVTNVLRVGVSYLGDGKGMTENGHERGTRQGKLRRANALELPVGHRGVHAHDRAAWHGHRHDECVFNPQDLGHRRSGRAGGQHR